MCTRILVATLFLLAKTTKQTKTIIISKLMYMNTME